MVFVKMFDTPFWLIYKFLESVSLAAILSNDEAAQELSWSQRLNVLKEADGLSYLHHDCFPQIVHRDRSSKNMLLDLEYEAHISDFGISKFLKPARPIAVNFQALTDTLHQVRIGSRRGFLINL